MSQWLRDNCWKIGFAIFIIGILTIIAISAYNIDHSVRASIVATLLSYLTYGVFLSIFSSASLFESGKKWYKLVPFWFFAFLSEKIADWCCK